MSAYRKYLGKNFSFIGFEIQEELIPVASWRNPGVSILNKAVGDKNTFARVHASKTFSVNYRGGSSILPHKYNTSDYEDTGFDVEVIDLVQFIELRRNDGFDFVAVKMDIEGAEYPILRILIKAQEISNKPFIDYLIIEFHPEVLEDLSEQDYFDKMLSKLNIRLAKWF